MGGVMLATALGWPVALGALYVGLIVAYPNRRSDNAFERWGLERWMG